MDIRYLVSTPAAVFISATIGGDGLREGNWE